MIELSLPPKTPSIHGDSAGGEAGFGETAGVDVCDAQPSSSSELDELEDDDDADDDAAPGFRRPFDPAVPRLLLRLTGVTGGRSCLINCEISMGSQSYRHARPAPP